MSDKEHDPRFRIARNLQRLMRDRGVTGEQLARRTELSEARIKRFLDAEAEPTARDLLRLASALDASIEQLLERIAWKSDGEGGGEVRVERPDVG